MKTRKKNEQPEGWTPRQKEEVKQLMMNRSRALKQLMVNRLNLNKNWAKKHLVVI